MRARLGPLVWAFVVASSLGAAGCRSAPSTTGAGGAGGSSGGAAGMADASIEVGAGGTGAAGQAGSAGQGGAAGAPRDGGDAVDVADGGGADISPIACTPGVGTSPVGTGSLLDRKTCLVWPTAASGAMNNKQAALHCDELTQDGFSDWRVARPEELATWPNLAVDSNAYVTGPTYVPAAAASVEEGCRGNSHSCNLTQYNAGSIACAWQGVGFVGPAVCVRGAATPGSLPSAYAATTCDACRSHVTGAAPEFKIADCLPYAR